MDGLIINLMDVKRFIKENSLEESIVTDPHYLIRGYPTPKGVLSHEIFGSTVEDRKQRMGIIRLWGKYMTPLAAKRLKAYDNKLASILFSTRRYRLEGNELIADDLNGRTGPSFLYEIWGKYKPKAKTTITTKEIEKFFNRSRDELFIEYMPIIPAFYRDTNTQTGSKMSLADINSIYSKIITLAENLHQFSDNFTFMKPQTEALLQSAIVSVYDKLMIEKVKGSPAKFGMLRRFWQSKSVTYTARLVITAPILTTDTVDDMQVRFGYALVPLSYICSTFFPFIIHELKKFFDNEFIRGGKYPAYDMVTKKIVYLEIEDTYDEDEITNMITKFLNSPSTRFDVVPVPGKYMNNQRLCMTIPGTFLKDATTFIRPATITDVLYIVAKEVSKDKHVYVTRYPLESYNGQFPARIEVSSTINTNPVQIGQTTYQFYPVVEGDPSNAFVETLGFSNTYLSAIGGDYDGDCTSIKSVFTDEANAACERYIQSNAYILDVGGHMMRDMTKDFVVTAYNLTKTDSPSDLTADCNKEKPMYVI